jgi:hypothetical protein
LIGQFILKMPGGTSGDVAGAMVDQFRFISVIWAVILLMDGRKRRILLWKEMKSRR